MKKICLYIFLGLLITGTFSCGDSDWLAPRPLSFYAPENVYIDEAGFNALLISMRKDLRAEHYDGGAHDFPGKLFNLAYNSIKNTNVLVSRIDDISWNNEETRNRLLAGALFYRAYWYYRLVNSYGDVPFIGEEITGPKLDFHTHSRWAILDKIMRDCPVCTWIFRAYKSPSVTGYRIVSA